MNIEATFNLNDPFFIDTELTESEKKSMLNAREFAEKILKPRVKNAFRTETLDSAVIQAMGSYNIIAAGIETAYGGTAENAVAYGLIARELERIDSGYRTIFSVTSSLVARAIALFGSEAQKEKYLPLLAAGKLISSFALTEPNHGSDPGGMETRAVKKGNSYILNGHKRWIGLAPNANIIIIFARDQENEIRGFIVDRLLPGIETPLIEGKFSLRTAPTGEVLLKNVIVNEDAFLPHAQGLHAPFQCLNAARFSIAWGALGAAEDCFKIALTYALQRKQFGNPLAANQLVQQKLVNMHTELNLNLLACLRMGRLIDQGKGSPELISMLKRNSSAKALEIARLARDILGGNGILDDYSVIRHLLNLEAVNTYEGTYDIHTLILGRALTGMQAFK